nr:MAG TPA: hypothetical protein [Caudoviricetes sp.]
MTRLGRGLFRIGDPLEGRDIPRGYRATRTLIS